MNENNGFTTNENGFQDPTVTPVQPDAAVSAENNTAPEQPTVPTPPTYEQYAAAQQAAAQQPQNSGYNPQSGGQPYNAQPQYQQPPMYQDFQPNVQPIAQTNGLAIASLVVGIVANVCCGFPLGIVALILGIVGLSKSKTMCGGGRGMAIAGIVLGVVSIVFGIAAMIIYSMYGYELFQNIQENYDFSTDFYSMIRMYLPL